MESKPIVLGRADVAGKGVRMGRQYGLGWGWLVFRFLERKVGLLRGKVLMEGKSV